MKLYTLVGVKIVSMEELKTCVTLDEALKMYALWQMTQDIEAAKADEMKDKIGKGGKGGRIKKPGRRR